MLVPFLKKNKLTIFLIVVFISLRLPSLFEPYWYGDEGIYLTIGQALNRGAVLYRQIHDNKPPTLYYLAAFSETVFGFRLLLTVWMIPTVYLFFLLASKFFNFKLSYFATLIFIIITSIPLFEGNIANAEIFMLLPTIFTVYILYDSSDWIKLFFSGLLLGFAFTIKIPVFIEFIFLVLWLFFSIFKFDVKKNNWISLFGKIATLSITFLIPILIYLIYFIFHNALNEFLFSALFQNFGYLSSWSTGSHSGSATSSGLVTRGILLLISWFVFVILLTKKLIKKEIAFIAFWYTATIFGATLSTRPYPHYLIQVLPPTILLIVYLFTSLKKITLYFLIGLLSLIIFFFYKYKFYVYPVFSYYTNFYRHITNLNSTEYRQYFGNSINDIYQIADFINQNTSPAEKIFVWGDAPYLYALSNRTPVGKYTVAYHVVDFNQYEYVYKQLTINFPKLIIYYPQPNRPFPALDNFIFKYYSPVKSFGSTVIYRVR